MIEIQIVSNRFPQLAGQLDAALESALNAGVETLIAVADPLTPVDTGFLRANKVISASPGSRTVTWSAEYSAYVEMGTRYMSAQSFAGPGADAAVPVIEAELARFGS